MENESTLMQKRFSVVIALGPGRQIAVLDSLGKTDFPKHKYEVLIEEGLNPSVNRNR